MAIIIDCSKIRELVIGKIKDYVSYIRSYDQNRNMLAAKLEDLSCKKQDISTEVKKRMNKLEKITREAEGWLQRVRRLSQNEELKKLVVREYIIAEKAVKLMEEEDLKKLLRKDNALQGVVMEVVENNMGKENDNEDYKIAARVVRDVLKDISEDFKRLMISDMKMAVVATKLLEHEDLERISQGDPEMADTLMRARNICEENLWEMNNDDSDVREMLRPLQKLTENENFLKILPENAKLGVEVINGLIKGSDGLKNEITKRHKEDGCYCCTMPFMHYHHRYEMSKAAEQLAKNVASLIEKPPTGPVTLPVGAADLKPIPLELVKGLESREELLRTILEKLHDDQVNVVGVFGMGGTGKTTLAKGVVDSRVKCNFSTIIMCEISETPNIKHIQDQIAEALDLPLHDVNSVSHRAIKLYNRLKQENGDAKILIILDNLWQKLNVEEIGIPCESTNDYCCKFLLTSREKNICQMMGVRDANIFHMGLLNERESRELFGYHVGKTILEGDYKSMAQRLLNKCGGLPLTIVATANALKGKELSMWQHFVDELEKPISSQVSGMHRETYAILQTSYNVMESEEKKMFFLLGCLSPLGSSISIENLMRYAVGLDLIQHVNKLSEAMEQAFTWSTELISSSMLLKGDFKGHVKIHDVVRASAIYLAAKDKHKFLVEAIPRWMCNETFNQYTAISLSSNHNFSRLNGVKARMLQILLLRGDLSSFSELDGCFFQGMPNLKVLHLSCMNLEPVLPESIGDLTNLKTLHLEKCKLGDISLIGELIELLVLSVRDSVLDELPMEMGKLCKLRILDMHGCKVNLKRSPASISVIASLSSLEGLQLFDNFKEWATMTFNSNYIEGPNTRESIVEFHDHEFPHLNLLEVHVEKSEHLPIGRFAKNLDMFNVCVSEFSDELKGIVRPFHCVLEFNGTADVNNALKNNSCLEALLKRADFLRFFCTRLEKNIVPELDIEGFRDLKYLEVEEYSSMECFISIDGWNDSIPFPNLEYLKISWLEKLKIICKGEAPQGMFNNLQHVLLNGLTELQYALPVPLQYYHLTEINISTCPCLKFIFYENEPVFSVAESEEHKEMDVIDLPCLKSLITFQNFNLVGFLGQNINLFTNPNGLEDQTFFNKKIICPSLELLRLHECHKVKSLWSKELHMPSFRNLKEISIQNCESLRSLGSASTLVQLERLTIQWAPSMHDVITKGTEEFEYPENTIKFSQLRDLELHCLLNLESFCGGSYKVQFPELKKLKLSNLPNFSAFVVSEDSTALFCDKVEFPSLEELEVSNVIKETHTQLLAMEDAPNLRKLVLDNIKGLRLIPPTISLNLSSLCLNNVDVDSKNTFIISTSESSPNEDLVCINSSQLPKLEHLRLKDFGSLEHLFENEDDGTVGAMSMFCRQLKHLELEKLLNLNLVALRLFKNLRTLCIHQLKWKYVFPSDLILEMLEDIEISDCEKMKVVIQDEQEADSNDRPIFFPRLKALKLDSLRIHRFSSTLDVAIHFPSLETLKIKFCQYLNIFSSGSLVAPKLKEVELNGCLKMKSFLSGNPSQVVEFPSVQRLTIRSGYNMQSFSTRPLKAPILREVVLSECKDMQWFLPGYPNQDDVLELPSLEILQLHNSNLWTFTPGPLKAPMLSQVSVDDHDHSIQEMDNLNDFLQNLYEKRNERKTGQHMEEIVQARRVLCSREPWPFGDI